MDKPVVAVDADTLAAWAAVLHRALRLDPASFARPGDTDPLVSQYARALGSARGGAEALAEEIERMAARAKVPPRTSFPLDPCRCGGRLSVRHGTERLDLKRDDAQADALIAALRKEGA